VAPFAQGSLNQRLGGWLGLMGGGWLGLMGGGWLGLMGGGWLGLMGGLDDLGGLFQPMILWFYDTSS